MTDPGIEALSKEANDEQTVCPVTLLLNGNMVTGHIVGKDTFEADTSRMMEMAREHAEAEDGTVEALDQMISAMMEALGTDGDPASFIHVSVQEVMTGAEAIHLGGSVFRFQASQIEGFTIGTVETTEA